MKYEYKLEQYVLDNIEELIKEHKDLFDEDMFRQWYWDNNVAYKSNPSAYTSKVFKDELLNGRFKRVKPIVNCIPMYNEMRKLGIKVITHDTLYISIMEQFIIDEKIATQEELIELNHKAINYIIGKYDNPNTGHFIEVFRKSKLKINFEEIDDLYDKTRTSDLRPNTKEQ